MNNMDTAPLTESNALSLAMPGQSKELSRLRDTLTTWSCAVACDQSAMQDVTRQPKKTSTCRGINAFREAVELGPPPKNGKFFYDNHVTCNFSGFSSYAYNHPLLTAHTYPLNILKRICALFEYKSDTNIYLCILSAVESNTELLRRFR